MRHFFSALFSIYCGLAATTSMANLSSVTLSGAFAEELTEAFQNDIAVYTAELTDREGEPFFAISAVSETAHVVDQVANNGRLLALIETERLLQTLSSTASEPPSDFAIAMMSRNLIFSTITPENISEAFTENIEFLWEDAWGKNGLSVGFVRQGPENIEAISAREWMGGTIFVNPSDKFSKLEAQTVEFSDDTVAGLSVARMKEIAQEATDVLFLEVAQTSCSATLRPREISPSVSVSFNLFAGAEFAISATFDMADTCEKLGFD